MNNKLKVIDLLVKIANGKTPPKIKFKNTKPIFEYNIRNGKYEYCYKSNKGKNEICELTFLNLNDEIELIEEPEMTKEVEIPKKLDYKYKNTYGNMSVCKHSEIRIIDTLNDILDYLKAKEERKEK